MRTPWHIWVVGLIALIFNAGGAFDYVMTQTRNADYLAQFTAEELAYFESFPSWVQGSWALAVWAALLGAVLILLRSRWAGSAFAVSVIAMLATFTHNFFLGDPKMDQPKAQPWSRPSCLWFSPLAPLLVAVADVAQSSQDSVHCLMSLLGHDCLS